MKKGKMRRTKLKQLRVGLHLTQGEMADKIGISANMYNFLENGDRNGSYEVWQNLQNTFHIPDTEMWGLQKLNGSDNAK